MSHWTDEFSEDNPAVFLYRVLRDNPDYLSYIAARLGHPEPEEAELDEDSYREAAEFCAEEVEVD